FGDMFGDLNDMFGDFFGGGRRSGSRGTRARQGDDILGKIDVTFEEAFKGVKKRITVSRSNLCDRCKGNGAEPGHSKKKCPSCQGTGQVKVSQGFFSVAQVCPSCKGEGRIVEKPCSSCSGTGYVKDKKKVEVPVPAGINDGQRIRIGGEGNAGMNGGPRGDVYVEIRVKPHEIFERRGDDIYVEYPVTYSQLVLGDSVDVPTMEGKVSMKIPAGTQPSTKLRLKKRGFPSIQKVRRGDQFVILKLEVPRNISGEHKKKIKELKSFDSELKERPFLKDFMNKVKGLFS
ncbi:MAG: DnaJ C-terminal domain-containing protein, partial [bacterium]